MDRRFFHRLGASQLDRTICSEAGGVALTSVNGAKYGVPPEDYKHARYIIAWAANIHGTNIHLWPFVEEARRDGAKLVVIDPFRTRTARAADWHLAIRPGTDVALALGLINYIIANDLYDAPYVAAHTSGFEELRTRAAEYTPQRVAEITGLGAEEIVRLAREYATTNPSVIRLNYGVQRSENGGMAVRAITMLPAITGAWKQQGGGLTLSTSGTFAINKAKLQRADLMTAALGRPARTLNMNQLGKLLTDAALAPPVKALFVYACNPAAVCPNRNLVVEGLKRPDLFTVVHEQFFTDTTDYADIVLPATTFLEHKDLVPSYGHLHLQLSSQAIEALGESCSNAELFRRLAARMGLEDECLRASDDHLIDDALASMRQAQATSFHRGHYAPGAGARTLHRAECSTHRTAYIFPLRTVLPPPAARPSCTARRWLQRDWTRWRPIARPPNRGTANRRASTRWSCSRASMTTFSTPRFAICPAIRRWNGASNCR